MRYLFSFLTTLSLCQPCQPSSLCLPYSSSGSRWKNKKYILVVIWIYSNKYCMYISEILKVLKVLKRNILFALIKNIFNAALSLSRAYKNCEMTTWKQKKTNCWKYCNVTIKQGAQRIVFYRPTYFRILPGAARDLPGAVRK